MPSVKTVSRRLAFPSDDSLDRTIVEEDAAASDTFVKHGGILLGLVARVFACRPGGDAQGCRAPWARCLRDIEERLQLQRLSAARTETRSGEMQRETERAAHTCEFDVAVLAGACVDRAGATAVWAPKHARFRALLSLLLGSTDHLRSVARRCERNRFERSTALGVTLSEPAAREEERR